MATLLVLLHIWPPQYDRHRTPNTTQVTKETTPVEVAKEATAEPVQCIFCTPPLTAVVYESEEEQQ
eukprot:1154090-Pelagomonas_calceolata.AAC.9